MYRSPHQKNAVHTDGDRLNENINEGMRSHPADQQKKSKKGKKKMTRAGSVISLVVIIIAACVLCFSAYKLITIAVNYNRSADSYDGIREMFTAETKEEEPDESATTNKDVQSDFVWDYDKLYAINNDAIGYIRASGDTSDETVDYPIVKGDDNSYYLDHLFTGVSNSAGSIFMDYTVTDDFDSTYSILYGHNMKSGARMFSCLTYYQDEAYFKAHPEMHIYTKDKHYIYKVFAQNTTDIYSDLYSTSLLYQGDLSGSDTAGDEIDRLVNIALSANTYDMGVSADYFSADSHIILLSTCTRYNYDTGRYVVLLVRDREV